MVRVGHRAGLTGVTGVDWLLSWRFSRWPREKVGFRTIALSGLRGARAVQIDDPAAAVPVPETIGLGIDDAALDIPKIVVTTIAVAGDDASMRQFARDGFTEWHGISW